MTVTAKFWVGSAEPEAMTRGLGRASNQPGQLTHGHLCPARPHGRRTSRKDEADHDLHGAHGIDPAYKKEYTGMRIFFHLILNETASNFLHFTN